MGAAVGKSKGQMAVINITPLVDVVLVLLIIFMVIIKGDSAKISNIIPKKAEAEEAVALESQQLVLEILKDNDLMLNGSPIADKDFPEQFRKLMEGRSDKKLFVSADDDVLWERITYWMSVARSNGASLVALQMIPPQYESISK